MSNWELPEPRRKMNTVIVESTTPTKTPTNSETVSMKNDTIKTPSSAPATSNTSNTAAKSASAPVSTKEPIMSKSTSSSSSSKKESTVSINVNPRVRKFLLGSAMGLACLVILACFVYFLWPILGDILALFCYIVMVPVLLALCVLGLGVSGVNMTLAILGLEKSDIKNLWNEFRKS